MKNSIIAKVVVVAVLVGGIGSLRLLAQHAGHGGYSSSPQPAEVTRTGKIKGKVVEINQNSIGVETEQRGRTETVFYFIDARTKIKGNLEVGESVVVKYREEYSVRTATSIEVKKSKRAGS